MTTASATTAEIRFDRPAQVQAAVIGAAFIAVFFYVIRDMAYEWRTSSDWSHGWLVPVFSAYLVFTKWEQIRREPIRGTLFGLILMIVCLLAYQFTLWAFVIGYVRPLAMLGCLLGLVVYLNGVGIVRHIWLPWLYLLFAVPLPKAVYFGLTDPLRQISASVATGVLSLVPSLQIERIGSNIEAWYNGVEHRVGVVDACSGMRSTITLCALGVAVAFLSERPAWQRVVMVLACVPIALAANFVRVTTTCVIHIFIGKQYAEGTYHTMLGLATLMVALGMFAGLGWILSHLFVESNDDDTEDVQTA